MPQTSSTTTPWFQSVVQQSDVEQLGFFAALFKSTLAEKVRDSVEVLCKEPASLCIFAFTLPSNTSVRHLVNVVIAVRFRKQNYLVRFRKRSWFGFKAGYYVCHMTKVAEVM